MEQQSMPVDQPVWDRTVRIFHWVNVLSVIALIAIGVAILNAKALGVSTDGKILLKTWHVYIGYVFAINLAWRLLWAFVGSRFSRWSAILPFGTAYKKQQRAFIAGLKQGKPANFLGHSPAARWMVSLLLLLLITQAVTGLLMAGTDVYMPPLGGQFKAWIAQDAASVAEIKPYSQLGVNKENYTAMRNLKKPFAIAHYYAFYIMLAAIVLHIIGVVVSELSEKHGFVSAMITGNKKISGKAVDMDD